MGALPGRAGEWVLEGCSGPGLGPAFEAGRALAHAMVGDTAVAGAELFDPARLGAAKGGENPYAAG